MDQAGRGADVDLPGSEPDFVESIEAPKGHRKADPVWDQFNKRKLPVDKAVKLKRNWDAECKGCGTEVSGKPQIMKRHLVDCDKAIHYSQLLALKDHTKHTGSDDSGSVRAST